MEELAKVEKVENGLISVVSEIKSACSGCQQVDNCGSGQVAKAFPTKKLSLTLQSQLSVNVGDIVVLGIPQGCVLQSAWQVYLYPIAGLITLSGVGQYLVTHQVLPHEIFAIVLGALGGFLGFRLAKSKQNKEENKNKLTPSILRVASPIIPTVSL
jgi:sigma-E factor negative regulatory protein RseC